MIEHLQGLPPGAAEAILRNDLASFTRGAFAVLNPGTPMVWAKYLDLICSRLQGVADGNIRRLIITLPPRHLKSFSVSTALPAFFLGHNPSMDVMCVSYNQSLARVFAEDTRHLMRSAFYTEMFDTRLAPGRQSLGSLQTTDRGKRLATSMQGTATGIGADLLILDDPQRANTIHWNQVRDHTNSLFQSTFVSRANNPAKSRTIIVMQRLHEDDMVGFVTGLGADWEILNLPAIAEDDEEIAYSSFLGRHVFRRAIGEPLNPARITSADLAEVRENVGEANWATQFQQRPAPAGGGVVVTAWFKRYTQAEKPEQFDKVVQSWDIASGLSEKHDYSVCTTWGVKDKYIYLLDVDRERQEFPDLKGAVLVQAALHTPNSIVIEDMFTGIALIQDLQRDGVPKIVPYKPQGDKRTRMEGQTGPIKAGFVLLPTEAHWLDEYLHEMEVFPLGRNDDQVDSTSQALDNIRNIAVTGGAYLEIARRANAARGIVPKPTPYKPEYQPGSMEWAAEQAAIKAAKDAEGGLPLAA